MSGQSHRSDPAILDRRRLADDHRTLAALLAPGMAVLDVGCGTGAITKGIADAVGPGGIVVGVDRDPALVERARAHVTECPHLTFEHTDAIDLAFAARFDIVTAARTLQWIADPQAAVRRMVDAVRPGGLLVVLDYNHDRNAWDPSPPPAFSTFYARFLAWRASHGWDNAIGDRCPALFAAAGLQEIAATRQDETSARTDADIDVKTALWLEVIDALGPTLQQQGVCDAALLETARRAYESWRRTDLVRQTLSMTATVGRRPAYRASDAG